MSNLSKSRCPDQMVGRVSVNFFHEWRFCDEPIGQIPRSLVGRSSFIGHSWVKPEWVKPVSSASILLDGSVMSGKWNNVLVNTERAVRTEANCLCWQRHKAAWLLSKMTTAATNCESSELVLNRFAAIAQEERERESSSFKGICRHHGAFWSPWIWFPLCTGCLSSICKTGFSDTSKWWYFFFEWFLILATVCVTLLPPPRSLCFHLFVCLFVCLFVISRILQTTQHFVVDPEFLLHFPCHCARASHHISQRIIHGSWRKTSSLFRDCCLWACVIRRRSSKFKYGFIRGLSSLGGCTHSLNVAAVFCRTEEVKPLTLVSVYCSLPKVWKLLAHLQLDVFKSIETLT